ncbi:MAG: AMP-binding protein [Duncaniella sp.]|nr:AMP-binding protein [Duncaniella sp.]
MTFADFYRQWTDASPYIEAHTSGSTGEPKVIRLLKTDMELSARATCRRFGIDGGSVLATPLSADYIAGKMMAVRQAVSGARLVELPRSRTPLRDYSGDPVDLLAIVPAQIPDLLDALKRGVEIRDVIVGGAPVSPADETRLAGCGASVFATYGMTETCSHIALRPMGHDVYTVMPGISVSLNADGCLRIDTGAMNVGVLDTRDVCEVLSPAEFRWLGRMDNVINSGGIKLHPEEIERSLAEVMEGREFYITKRASTLWGEEAVMVVVTGDDELPVAVLDRISETLPGYMRPKDIIYDSSPEYTQSGKLKRRSFV